MAFSDIILAGIEIGTSKVCCVVAEVDGEGGLRILGAGETESVGVRKGEIVDMKYATECVHDALSEAETNSEVRISDVIAVVSGSHIQGCNSRGSVRIERGEIVQADIDAVVANASEVSNIPPEQPFLHNIVRYYYVDGQAGVVDPIGMEGSQLDVDVHIIHGITNRLQNTTRCIEENDVKIEKFTAASLASAYAVTDVSQRDSGVLVIDIGGGVTDWVVFAEGVVRMSGVLAVGGDHVDNDISLGLHLPTKRAKVLKETKGNAVLPPNAPPLETLVDRLVEGNAILSPEHAPDDIIVLKNEGGFAGKNISRCMLNAVVHVRMKNIFEIIKRQASTEIPVNLLGMGVVLTGGSSLLAGITEVAESVFGVPAQLGREVSASGPKSILSDPRYATVIGAIRHRQMELLEEESEGGFFDKFKRIFGR